MKSYSDKSYARYQENSYPYNQNEQYNPYNPKYDDMMINNGIMNSQQTYQPHHHHYQKQQSNGVNMDNGTSMEISTHQVQKNILVSKLQSKAINEELKTLNHNNHNNSSYFNKGSYFIL